MSLMTMGAAAWRRASGPVGAEITFDPTRKNASVSLSNANRTASTIGSGANYRARLTGPKSSGKWHVEFTVDAMGVNFTYGVQEREVEGSAVLPYPSGRSGTYLGGISYDYHYNGNSSSAPSVPGTPQTGEVWGFTIDFSTKLMTLYRNGAFKNEKIITGLDLSGSYVYVPFVGLWAQSGGGMTVSVNPTIAHPVAGFEPWSE